MIRLRRLVGPATLVYCACALVSGCSYVYGADFGYPSDLSVPSTATVVSRADGSDDDDPMRGREIVIDVPSATSSDVVAFYRGQFPASAGWSLGEYPNGSVRDALLCLGRVGDQRYDEYVEIYSYAAEAKSAGPHRYLVSVSRMEAVTSTGRRTVDRCGEAGAWYPSDL